MKAKDAIREYAVIAFTLLGVLFGMMIMTFIFGNLGPEQSGLTIGTEAYNTSLEVQNNSLQSISSYTAQADTQLNTVAIAIILVILIGVFLLFWQIFVGGGKGKKAGGGSQFG